MDWDTFCASRESNTALTRFHQSIHQPLVSMVNSSILQIGFKTIVSEGKIVAETKIVKKQSFSSTVDYISKDFMIVFLLYETMRTTRFPRRGI